jgi:hypothetical protein
MRGLTFDDVFAMWSAVALSTSALARLREWIASITHEAVNAKAAERARGAIHI